MEDLRATLRSGFKITDKEALDLENSLQAVPTALDVRVKLLGSYWFKKNWDAAVPHLSWIIENHPESEVLGWEAATVGDLSSDHLIYDALKASWEKMLKKFPANAKVLANGAAFFLLSNRKRSIELLEKSVKVDPDCMESLEKLSQTYEIEVGHNFKSKHLKRALEVQKQVVEHDKDNVAKVTYLALLLFYVGEKEDARKTSERAISLLSEKPDAKKLAKVHCVRGLIYVQQANIDAAKKELLAQGHYPELALANKLMEMGQLQVVREYLEKNYEQWQVGRVQYLIWNSMLNFGIKPKFNQAELVSNVVNKKSFDQK